jgi:hypothetical protein
MKSQHTKAHTFASRTSPNRNQSLQKSVLFSRPRRNSIFFSPTLRCFNFFATAQQPMTDKYLDRTMQDTNRQELDMDEEARTGNSGFAKKRVQWLIEHSASHQLLCYVDSLVLRNPLLRKAAKRWWQF